MTETLADRLAVLKPIYDEMYAALWLPGHGCAYTVILALDHDWHGEQLPYILVISILGNQTEIASRSDWEGFREVYA